MAWWNKIISAAKSAVNKAVYAVQTVVNTVKKTISKTVSTVKTAVSRVSNTIKKSVSDSVTKAITNVEEVKDTAKKIVINSVKKAVDIVEGVKEEVKDTARKVVESVKEKVEEVKEVVKERVEDVVKAVKRKTWPNRPADLPRKLWPYWERMEEAYVNNDKRAMMRVLRALVPMTASPTPALVVIGVILGVMTLVITVVGSYTFAGFIREEALQTIDFAIRTATFEKDLEGLEKAIAFKKELLERTFWEKIIGAIPFAGLKKELDDFYKASAVKLEVDEKVFESMRVEMTGEGMPELIEATVRDIIDGDTIDVSLEARNKITGEIIGLPQYANTTHARVRLVGINAPEKSPKGEILCSDVEIYEVEKEFADKSRDRLRHLNDKRVILKVDPNIPVDSYSRILAVVEFNEVDINLRQIKEGLACGYYREPHKYFSETEYSEATLTAKSEGIGMWAGLEEIEREEEKIKIRIISTPTNAKLFLDDIALHHNTPSDEVELSDVIHLFTEGKHVLSAEKAGLSAMEDITITKGDNGTFNLILVTAPFPEAPTPEEIKVEELKEEIIEEEIEEKEIIEKIVEPVELVKIPEEYTTEQAWALKEAFAKVLELTEGREVMSAEERENLFAGFVFYTDVQKEVLNLLMKDITFYTEGVQQISADEYIELKEKYRMI